MPRSRKISAVPFVGKDVPSEASEFAHPDVMIGLTINAYRVEGLRRDDFRELMSTVQEKMWEEVGPYHKRPSSKRFVEWVTRAGALRRNNSAIVCVCMCMCVCARMCVCV